MHDRAGLTTSHAPKMVTSAHLPQRAHMRSYGRSAAETRKAAEEGNGEGGAEDGGGERHGGRYGGGRAGAHVSPTRTAATRKREEMRRPRKGMKEKRAAIGWRIR